MIIDNLYDTLVVHSILHDYGINISNDVNTINIDSNIRDYINTNIFSIYATNNRPDLRYKSFFIDGKYVYTISLFDILNYINYNTPWTKELKSSIVAYPNLLTQHHSKTRLNNLDYKLYGDDVYNIHIITDLEELDNKLRKQLLSGKFNINMLGDLYTITARVSISYNDILDIQTIMNKPLNYYKLDRRNGVIKIDDNEVLSREYKTYISPIAYNDERYSNKFMLNIITMTFTINEWCKIFNLMKNKKSAIYDIKYFLSKYQVINSCF